MDKPNKDTSRGPSVRFDVPRMFALAGGRGKAADMARLLVRHLGRAPELPAVQMWFTRGVIPSQWQAAVLYCLIHEGVSVRSLFTRELPL